MTKRELLKQARHVLGQGVIVEVERIGRLYWSARAYTATFGVMAGGITRDQAITRADAMLLHIDTSGWDWRLA